MIPEVAVWTIFMLPLCALVIIALVIRPFFNRYSVVSGPLLIVFLIAAFGISIWALASTIHYAPLTTFHEWVTVGELTVRLGVLLNPITAVMLVVVTGVSLIVLMSIELMFNAVNIALVAMARFLTPAAVAAAPSSTADIVVQTLLVGQVFAIFIIAVAAAEVALGLGIIIALYRQRETVDITETKLLKL